MSSMAAFADHGKTTPAQKTPIVHNITVSISKNPMPGRDIVPKVTHLSWLYRYAAPPDTVGKI